MNKIICAHASSERDIAVEPRISATAAGRSLKLAALAGLAFLLSSVPVTAHVELELDMAHRRFILFEPLIAQVQITNNSSSALRIGGEEPNTVLRFDIKDHTGHPLRRSRDDQEIAEVSVEPWGSKKISVNLLRSYPVDSAMPYYIQAQLATDRGRFASQTVGIDIMPGMKILELRKSDEEYGTRIFELLTLNRNNREVLFLRIDDAERTLCYGVYELGNHVRVDPPQMLFDEKGQIRILFQSGPTRFTHHLFSARGLPLQKRFYTGRTGATRLRKNADGTVDLINAQEYQGDPYVVPDERLRIRAFE